MPSGSFVPAKLNELFGEAISSTAAQGSVIVKGSVSWVDLGPGTSGQFLMSNGTGANPSWGSVNLSAYLLLAGGTMTGALTLSGAPTSNLHAATKLYVDTGDSALQSQITANTTNISANTTAITGKVAKAGDSMTGNLLFSAAGGGNITGVRFTDATTGMWLNASNTLMLHSNSGSIGFSNYAEDQKNMFIFGNGTIESRLTTAAGTGGLQKFSISLDDSNQGISLTRSSGTIIDNAVVFANYSGDYQWHSANLGFPYSSTSLQMRLTGTKLTVPQLQITHTGSAVNDTTSHAIRIEPSGALGNFYNALSYRLNGDSIAKWKVDKDGCVCMGSDYDFVAGNTVNTATLYIASPASKSFPLIIRRQSDNNNLMFLDSSGNLTVLGSISFSGNINSAGSAKFATQLQSAYLQDNNLTKGYLSMSDSGVNFRFYARQGTDTCVAIQRFSTLAASPARLFRTTDQSGNPNFDILNSGAAIITATNAAPTDANLWANAGESAGSFQFYLDQSTNNLKARVKYTDGTLKTASITLTGGISVDANGTVTLSKALIRGYGSLTPSAGAVTPDASAGNTLTISTAADLTINNPINPGSWQAITFAIKNTDTVSHSITLGSAFRFGDNVTSIAAVAAGKTAYIGCIYNATDSKLDVVSNDGGH